jgi:hypothetical protein
MLLFNLVILNSISPSTFSQPQQILRLVLSQSLKGSRNLKEDMVNISPYYRNRHRMYLNRLLQTYLGVHLRRNFSLSSHSIQAIHKHHHRPLSTFSIRICKFSKVNRLLHSNMPSTLFVGQV